MLKSPLSTRLRGATAEAVLLEVAEQLRVGEILSDVRSPEQQRDAPVGELLLVGQVDQADVLARAEHLLRAKLVLYLLVGQVVALAVDHDDIDRATFQPDQLGQVQVGVELDLVHVE